MNFKKKAYLASACALLLTVSNTASAQKNNYYHQKSKDFVQMQRAYQQLVKKPVPQARPIRKAKIVRNGRLNPARARIVATAKRQLRKRYRWGGATPRTGFDCSGLTYYAFKSANIRLPRTAADQYRHTKRVSLSRLQAGDLIFFHTRRTKGRVNHVGIYLGNGQFIHAPRRGRPVSITSLSNKYWRKKIVGAGRV